MCRFRRATRVGDALCPRGIWVGSRTLFRSSKLTLIQVEIEPKVGILVSEFQAANGVALAFAQESVRACKGLQAACNVHVTIESPKLQRGPHMHL